MAEHVIISTSGPNGDPICCLCGMAISLQTDWPQWHRADNYAPTGVVHRNCSYAIQLMREAGPDYLPGEFGSLTRVMRETPTAAFIQAFAGVAISLANQVEAQIAAEQAKKRAASDFRLKPARIIQPVVAHREGD